MKPGRPIGPVPAMPAHPRRLMMTRFMSLALVAVAIPAGAQTVEQVPQVTVNLAVTRLDTPVAVAAARSKIDRAAEDVCDTRARFL